MILLHVHGTMVTVKGAGMAVVAVSEIQLQILVLQRHLVERRGCHGDVGHHRADDVVAADARFFGHRLLEIKMKCIREIYIGNSNTR